MKRYAIAWLAALAATAQAQDLARQLSERSAAAVEAGARVLVAIEVTRPEAEPQAQQPQNWMERMMQQASGTGPYSQRPSGPVPGTIVSADGLIATTYFNVRDASQDAVRVRLPDGRWIDGEIRGYDAALDLAVIQVAETGLPTLEAAPERSRRPGHAVLAVGLSPDDEDPSVTQGFVSAPHRFWGFCIGHDARVNWANLGGPLVDLDGRLVGINGQVSADSINSAGLASGVSFAVLAERLPEEVATLATGRRNVGAFIGIQGEPLDEGGVRLVRIVPRTGAANAGLRVGDVVLAIDGEFVQTMEQVRLHVLRKNPGETIVMTVRRGEEQLEVTVELMERQG